MARSSLRIVMRHQNQGRLASLQRSHRNGSSSQSDVTFPVETFAYGSKTLVSRVACSRFVSVIYSLFRAANAKRQRSKARYVYALKLHHGTETPPFKSESGNFASVTRLVLSGGHRMVIIYSLKFIHSNYVKIENRAADTVI